MSQIHFDQSEKKAFDKAVQVLLPLVAVVSWLLTSLKHPEYGLIVAFVAQTLWLYLTYKGWKKANQIGGFVTTLFEISIITFGIVNYWFWS